MISDNILKWYTDEIIRSKYNVLGWALIEKQIKEDKTKLTLSQINNVNLNSITESGFYTSSGWSNNIVGLPAELNHNEGRAFYLVVFSLENGAYCQQVLYSFKGLIFCRAITGANSAFSQWRKINLI